MAVDFERARDAVCSEFGVSSEELLTPSRSVAGTAFARQVLMWLLHELGENWTEVGEWVSRDRTTARYAHEVVESVLERDGDMRKRVKRVRAAATV